MAENVTVTVGGRTFEVVDGCNAVYLYEITNGTSEFIACMGADVTPQEIADELECDPTFLDAYE